MPIVINEIEISVEVKPDTADGNDNPTSMRANFSQEEIIKECVEKVMEIINQKKER